MLHAFRNLPALDAESVRNRTAVPAARTMRGATAKPSGGRGGKVPFSVASLRRTRMAFQTSALGYSQSVAAIEIPAAGGFLRWMEMVVTGTTSANAATVTFNADGPFSALSFIEFLPPSGDPPIVPHNGYQLMLWNKYGVFSQAPPYSDPRRDPQFSLTAGSGGTGGSFNFSLRIPFEIDHGSGFGAITNSAANKSYLLNLTTGSAAQIYGVAPTSAPAIVITGWMYYWDEPASRTRQGTEQVATPLGLGSFSQLRIDQPPITAGDKYIKVNNGGPVLRMLLFDLRASNGTRASVNAADIPATWDFVFNTRDRWLISDGQLQSDMAEYFGYQVPTAAATLTAPTSVPDAAGNLDISVRAFPYFMEIPTIDGPRGTRAQYQVTADATLTQIRGTSFGATVGTMEIFTNLIRPSSAAALYPPGRIT